MKQRLGVVMDPLHTIHFKKDSTLAMLWAAQERNWQIFYLPHDSLLIRNGEPYAVASPMQVSRDPDNWHQLGNSSEIALASLDAILMRKDPPFDNEYLYATLVLETAERRGVLVVNRPSSLRDCNEKLFATRFPQCCPPHLVSSSQQLLREFYTMHQDIILKPLDGMGGSQVFRVKPEDPNLGVILETLTLHGKRTIMAQVFIPEIRNGDKRILIVDGEPIPYALARIPAPGETRGNLAAGGTGIPQPLSERDYWICNEVIPTLREKGLLFVGLDVIGDYLTEINVTSPTCIREIDQVHHLDIAGKLISAMEKRLHAAA